VTMTNPTGDPQCTPHQAAHHYANRGWRVLPITPGRKHPPIQGWQDAATTDHDTIDNWWTGLYRDHGVGIATGPATGLWVLDIDVSDGKPGRTNLDHLQNQHGRLPATVTAATGSNGRHLLFTWDPQHPVTNGHATHLPPGLDIRGAGGQIVAPPTIHPNGTPYRWLPGRAPGDLQVADAPDWLYRLLDPPAPGPVLENRGPTPAPVLASAGDDSAAAWIRQQHTWDQLLTADGWTRMHTRGDDTYWCRPGKNPRDGHSAVQHGHDGALVVFTTEIPADLARAGKPTVDGSGVSLSLFGYVAGTRHGGDRSAAARDARAAITALNRQTTTVALDRDVVYDEDGGELDEGVAVPERPARLAPILARDLARWVEETPAPEWLVSNFLAAGGDDYGLISAEPKIGKTWTVGDLSVAVAAGQPWMGRFDTRQGRVLVYIGEGGKRTAERRFQAIADHYQVAFADLPIWLVEGVPHLSVAEDELHLRNAIETIEPHLVIIDPLYLAARGSDSRQLIEMGAVLETAQRICQEYGAALLFAHHWNKSGTGTGGARSTGAGPWEWARVSLSMRADGDAVKSDPDGNGYISVVQKLIVEVEGGNVIPTTLNLRREIHSVPGSLTARLGYRLDVQEGHSGRAAQEDVVDVRALILAKIAAHPRRCTVSDLYQPGSPFRVGAKDRVQSVVTMMMNAGDLVAVEYRHPDTSKIANRLLVADPQLVPATSGGDVV
jgi:hypothetical protein